LIVKESLRPYYSIRILTLLAAPSSRPSDKSKTLVTGFWNLLYSSIAKVISIAAAMLVPPVALIPSI